MGCILPLTIFLDQISDICYLYKYWGRFSKKAFRVASLGSLVSNVILCFLAACYIAWKERNTNTGNLCGPCQKLGHILRNTFLCWTRWIHIPQCSPTNIQKAEEVDMKVMFNVLVVVGIFVEDVPQILLQYSNNEELQSWNQFEKVSLILAIAVIVLQFLNIFCEVCCCGSSSSNESNRKVENEFTELSEEIPEPIQPPRTVARPVEQSQRESEMQSERRAVVIQQNRLVMDEDGDLHLQRVRLVALQ